MATAPKIDEVVRTLNQTCRINTDKDEAARRLWVRALSRLTDEQIDRALQRMAEEHRSPFPPQPAQFFEWAGYIADHGKGSVDWPEPWKFGKDWKGRPLAWHPRLNQNKEIVSEARRIDQMREHEYHCEQSKKAEEHTEETHHG